MIFNTKDGNQDFQREIIRIRFFRDFKEKADFEIFRLTELVTSRDKDLEEIRGLRKGFKVQISLKTRLLMKSKAKMTRKNKRFEIIRSNSRL